MLSEFEITCVPRTSCACPSSFWSLGRSPHIPWIFWWSKIMKWNNHTDEGDDDYKYEENVWKLYFDGSINKNGIWIGFIIKEPGGKKLHVDKQLDFECANNILENKSCLQGNWSAATSLGSNHIKVFGDYLLIISQVNGL